MGSEDRIIALIDMDCFYVQVEEREHPENKGKPACVVQYKTWKGGGIISVNYEARAQGITRQMRGDEARARCPEVILYRIPELRGKADLTKYREAGKEVIDVLCQFGACVERASIDEAYLDLTEVVEKLDNQPSPNLDLSNLCDTHVVGWSSNSCIEGSRKWIDSIKHQGMVNNRDWKLYIGAELVKKMRTAIIEKTGFQCSAGIAHNKMLAKLACGIYKPNKQTLMPMNSVDDFFKTMPLKKVRHLGGKLGDVLIQEMKCTSMKDVSNLSEKSLQQKFDTKTGTWLYWYSRGIDNEPVTSRHLPKSIGCNKNFNGSDGLDSKEKIFKWLEQLCAEVKERLERDRETNKRVAKQLILTIRQDFDDRNSSYTRSMPLLSYDYSQMVIACMNMIIKKNAGNLKWIPPVTSIGIAATKFEDEVATPLGKIDRFFRKPGKSADEEGKCNTRDVLEIKMTGKYRGEKSLSVEEKQVGEEPIFVPKEFEEKDATENLMNESRSGDSVPKKGFFANRFLSKNYCGLSVRSNESSLAEGSISRVVKTAVTDFKSDKSGFSVQELLTDIGKPGHPCDKCGQSLRNHEIQEHSDFHMAMELHQDLSSGSSTSNSSRIESLTSSKKTAVKRAKNSELSNREGKRHRTIESFFRGK